MPAPARPQEYNSPPDEQVIRFDRYQLDLRSGELLKEGRKVRNTRTQRAMDSGGKFGPDSAEQAWKSAEADALFARPAHPYTRALLSALPVPHPDRPRHPYRRAGSPY